MELLFSLPLEESEQPYAGQASDYGGVFGAGEDGFYYLRKGYEQGTGYILREYRFTPSGLTETATYPISDSIAVGSHRLELCYRWAHLPNSPRQAVALGSAWGFDPTRREVVSLTPEERDAYIALRHLDVPYFHEESDFSFPPYTISHKGSFGYVCTRGGETVWSFRTQGYLYTDMRLYGETVVFGTAGAGGHFVALGLTDGAPVFDINTGGTDRYLTVGGRFYTYAGGKKGILSVGLDGSVESLPLPGHTVSSCPLWTDGDTLLCMSFGMKGGRYTTVWLNGVRIGG
jgi:hypothetical protein